MYIIIMAAYLVERVLLIRILKAVISAIEVETSPEYSSRSPPTVSRKHSVSFLCGLKLQTILLSVIFLSFGMFFQINEETCIGSWNISNSLE
jgi:hypothetical protein